jgi:hypothetical protein
MGEPNTWLSFVLMNPSVLLGRVIFVLMNPSVLLGRVIVAGLIKFFKKYIYISRLHNFLTMSLNSV